MMTECPEPLVPPDCDCRDLDGFMLNVERLMASELVALATGEEVAAALFLWCRAWKQIPAASLPDDDRVNAAFARLPLARFKKLRENVLRGFVRCSDGRLYHRFLAKEAIGAFERKEAFRRKRDADGKRLREWRGGKRVTRNETGSETPGETHVETRFVAEGHGQGQGQGQVNMSLSSLRSERDACAFSASGAPLGQSASLFKPTKAKAVDPDALTILTECLCEATARDVVAHRKALKKPLTPRAARELGKGFVAYGDPEGAAAEMIARGWQGFNPDWMDSARSARAGPVPQRFSSPQCRSPLDAGREIISEILDAESTGYGHQLNLAASDRAESRVAVPLRIAK